MTVSSKREKDIKYIKMEKPVVIVDLERPTINISELYEAIIDASFAMPEVGIYNLVLKANQKADIEDLEQKINRDNMLKCVVRIQSKSVLLRSEFANAGDNIIYCCYIGKDFNELQSHKNLTAIPTVIKATEQNYLHIIEFISKLDESFENTLVINANINKDISDDADFISWIHLDELYCAIIDIQRKYPSLAILMDYGILPLRLLTEHPCNGYVCSHDTCHSFKNNMPRRLFIDSMGEILPEHPKMPHNYSMGNILNNDFLTILEAYKDSQQHTNFLSLARNIYTKWVQTCPYRVIPWSDLMLQMARNENRGIQ